MPAPGFVSARFTSCVMYASRSLRRAEARVPEEAKSGPITPITVYGSPLSRTSLPTMAAVAAEPVPQLVAQDDERRPCRARLVSREVAPEHRPHAEQAEQVRAW